MKIAISTDAGFVSAHFGRCPSFTIAEIEEGKVLKIEEIKPASVEMAIFIFFSANNICALFPIPPQIIYFAPRSARKFGKNAGW